MYVISDLMGIDPADHPRLKVLFDRFFSTQTPPEEVVATLGELAAMMANVVATRRAAPGDDLTSALIAASEGGDRLTDEEIVSTLQLMVAAGHETTISLIVNAVVNLSTHPEQLELVRSGRVGWDAVVEETLRWSTPTSHVLIRFATEDVKVGDAVLPAGDALIVSYAAIGRDPQQHGPDADGFDITRSPSGTCRSATARTSAPVPRCPAWRPASRCPRCTPGSPNSRWPYRRRSCGTSRSSPRTTCTTCRSGCGAADPAGSAGGTRGLIDVSPGGHAAR